LKNTDKIYFKGLDSLRALGALAVLIGHIELSKKGFNIPNLMELSFFKNTSGHLGVILFFVLSGFLITFLLLKELEVYKTVYIKNFYIRRALRIWPIYYLMVLFLFFAFPFLTELEYFGKPDLNNLPSLTPTLVIYLLLVPNFVSFGISGLGGGFHLGTIGTEEQFYLIWPWFVKYFKGVYFLIIIFIIIISIPALPHMCDYFAFNYFAPNTKAFILLKQFGNFFTYFKINCMAIGGLFAWLYYNNKQFFLKILYHKAMQGIALIVGLGGWLVGFHVPFLNDEFYAILFAIIILNTATNESKLLSFDYKITNYLGKISYGIYVYHWVIIYSTMSVFWSLKEQNVWFNIAVYSISFLGTVAISHLSYFYFEIWFLKFKDRFAKIKTT